MIKPILQLYPVIPAESEEERARLRPIGRNAERYNEVLHGMTELVRTAERLGFWGVSTIEHHFHSEGYEVGPSPSVINAYWAAIVKDIRIGQIGYTMSAQNPLRVAEDTAILDHLTHGRSFVGFSRGYQRRWTNVLGQHLGSRSTASPASRDAEHDRDADEAAKKRMLEDDRINREIFQENIEIVRKAWLQDSFAHHSERWQIPAREGMDWEMADATSRLGAPGEIDANGRLVQISVAPAPFTKPHPPVFIGAAGSQETIRYAGENGFIPSYFTPASRAADYARRYIDAGAAAGKDWTFGQNQNLVRWIQIGDTTEQAYRQLNDYDVELYKNLYYPLSPYGPYDAANPAQSLVDSGLYLAGTVDEVRQQFVDQWTSLPAEYVTIVSHYGQQPLESAIRNLELFAEHVMPVLDEMAAAADAQAPATV